MITGLSFFSLFLAKDHSLDRNNSEKYISLSLSLRMYIDRWMYTYFERDEFCEHYSYQIFFLSFSVIYNEARDLDWHI